MQIHPITTQEDIKKTHEAYLELRPHLKDQDAFVNQVLAQMQEGFRIRAILQNNTAVACIGYRIMTTLAWGKIVYIDDLITREAARGHGFGDLLLKNVIQFARESGCKQVHLDTGYTRHAAHFVYLKNGFELNCHHLATKL